MNNSIKFLIASACLLGTFNVSGQTNLISNGSFEDYAAVPQNLGEWSKCEFWTNAGSEISHPDFFHYDGGLAADLPETPVGEIQTHSGKALMGFVAAKEDVADYREYLTNELSQTMNVGATYKLTFFVSNGNVTANSNCGLGVSDLGIAFTVNAPDQINNDVLPIQPQMEVDSVTYDRGWMRVECLVEANEPFRYLTIGVFKPDAEIQISQEANDPGNVAYYFIDDFTLEIFNPLVDFDDDIDDGRSGGSDSESDPSPENNFYTDDAEFYIPNAFTPDGDGLNDIFKPYSPNLENYTFSIFDRWGDVVFSTDNIAQGWNGKNKSGTRAECGVYIWRVTYLDEAEDGEKITRSLSGSINLIR